MNIIKQIEYNFVTGLIFSILGVFILDPILGIPATVLGVFVFIFGYAADEMVKEEVKAKVKQTGFCPE